jgi:signal transduction histidine kinase
MAQSGSRADRRIHVVNAHNPDGENAVRQARPAEAASVRLDREGRLLAASDAIMALHTALGGDAGGLLAVPSLLDLARHGLRLGMRLSRPVSIAGPATMIDLWCDCTPGPDGIDIAITSWREQPLPAAPSHAPGMVPLPRDPGAIHIRTDRAGRILAVDSSVALGPDWHPERIMLKPLASLMSDTNGHAVIDAASVDGHRVRLSGDDRDWLVQRVTADPHAGTRVVLTPAPPPVDEASAPAPPPLFDGERLAHMFGTQIGPALRLPIGRIIANAETIGGRLEGPLRADYANYASDIASAGRHLLALVDDLADLEAIEATGFSAAREPVDLADLARRAAGLLALKAADRSIRIDKPAEDESLPAIGEFRRVLQVLLNLLGNAINYAPDGSMIWLRLDDGPDWASVTIADQGPGLSAEDQQRLFNKWERLGRSGDGGSGLGLYISRRLALAMDGDLTVESAPGQGARFTLILPKE